MRKSSKPRKARGKNQPATGLRRFFFKLELLGKRSNPLHHDSNIDPTGGVSDNKIESSASGKENPHHTPKSRILVRAQPKRAALINEDPAESATIITMFDDAPFCCHEDLVTMSRERLVEVATVLNAKLPSALAIDVSTSLPTSHIRQTIELIVGLRGDVPRAPKALRVMTDSECNRRLPAEFDTQIEMCKTPQTSPLANRSRNQVQLSSLISSPLARLEEENESSMEVDRPSKKRKLLSSQMSSEKDSVSPISQSSTILPCLRRVQSHSLPQTTSPPSVGMLRSQSHNLGRSTVVDTAFAGENHARLRYKARQDSGARQQSLIPKPIGVPRRSERLRPATARHQTFSSLISCQEDVGASRLSTAAGDQRVPTSIAVKRKRGMEKSETEQQMTSGFGRMNMTGAVESSDMDARCPTFLV